ncbi:amidase [Actinopolymorpha cephalotaxi]|uniref:Amidase n=1 Tax=Actinopolymorpha cephalotaxi TaxID=504797 RepID=A0A1I3B3B0_9ACTN|nr:amidase [Actinopolymorpha cephalotaxi]NYH81219.1 amidase [Actinopolymorpha cephalotaxi]SFH56773.1 amidase [Actinopolymorpha cephalotaxi]
MPAAAPSSGSAAASSDPAPIRDPSPSTADAADLDAAGLRDRYAAGATSATEHVAALLRRIEEIDRSGPTVRSVLAVDPHAADRAAERDAERARGQVRGPLHGVPVLVKDNIDTAYAGDTGDTAGRDGGLPTTAGSLALAGVPTPADAPLVTALRAAGAVVLGKANLSEWANFRSGSSTSGWSAVGGLCVNPHALDRSAGGSSSGSAAAVAAGLAPLAVGTETDGSIVCPAALCGVVGIKPTVGLVSRTGVVPISHSQDTPGPIATTVADAALLLGVLAGADPDDAATMRSGRVAYSDYTRFCRPDGLAGARIGLPRAGLWGYSAAADALAEEAVRLLAARGATVVDHADLPSIDEIRESDAELTVLSTEFRADLESYLAARRPEGPRTLAELVAFNDDHADRELTYFGQDRFESALATRGICDPVYVEALRTCRRLGRTHGIDAALGAGRLDALVMPTYPPAWKIDLVNGDQLPGACSTPAAIAGYPVVTVPCGAVDGLPVGLAFVGTAWSEPTLIRLAYAFEQAQNALGPRARPAYRPAGIG